MTDTPSPTFAPTRRGMLAGGAALVSVVLARRTAQAQVRASERNSIDEAIREFAGAAKITPGKISFDVPPLVENGNSVPITLKMENPLDAGVFVKRIAVFNERNPQPNVAVFHFAQRTGPIAVSTRLRLATSQTLTAIAELSDGSYWSESADVIVTLAACTEELI